MRVLSTFVLALCGSALAASNKKCKAGSSSSTGVDSAATAQSAAKKNGNSNANSSSAQKSLTLLANLVNKNAAQSGLNASAPQQVASLTSTNNFVNFCEGKTLTNGLQVKEGSCNGIVMGDIPSTGKMIGAKFAFPKNFDVVKAFQDFTVKLQINNLETGSFTNPNTNYYGAPQQLNSNGVIVGHTHIVINKISSFQDTTPADATTFAFFKGVDPPADNGISSVVVVKGLEAGSYRLCSINTAANHQPVLMPVAQHNSNDDCVYFTAKFEGNARRSTHPRNNGPRRL